jgi:hypothetical protein
MRVERPSLTSIDVIPKSEVFLSVSSTGPLI